jgi:LETM1 and EF-hand domain-containing protein 1
MTVPKVAASETTTSAEVAVEKTVEDKGMEKKEVKKEEKKLTIMQKVKREAQHYWDGTKLLAAEVRISIRLALKMAAGYELSRRENRQVRLSASNFLNFS